jgi:beta-lactamase superfamily II metal-dependent hydrolase
MRIAIVGLVTTILAAAAQAAPLDVYVIDVEGGKSVLVISPSGESLLLDVGSSGREGRDTNRILEALKAAALTRIDYLVISHLDSDHVGDVPLLVSKFPVRRIVDNGPLQTTGKNVEQRYATYSAVRDKMDHTAVKPGDRIPIRGLEVRVVTAGGKFVDRPLPGGGQKNTTCANTSQEPELPQDLEDNMSIGLLFTLGKFRMLDLADLEAHYDYRLMCPVNPVGTVDVYQVSVHGQDKGVSPVLANAIKARVAITANGPNKGATPKTWNTLRDAPGLADIWQVHYSLAGGKENNPPDDYIANVDTDCSANWLKLSAQPDGSFTVTNSRNNFTKAYKPRN